MSMEQLDTLVKDIQADTTHMKLLQILSPQLEQLVKSGSPNLHMFYKDLKEAELLSKNDLRELKIRFALEGVGNQPKIVRIYTNSITEGPPTRWSTRRRN